MITGHMDFLQVRNGAVHILDYKPDARTNKPIAQLAIYALALTRLVPGPEAVRHQVRVVQRGRVLRVLSAHAVRTKKRVTLGHPLTYSPRLRVGNLAIFRSMSRMP